MRVACTGSPDHFLGFAGVDSASQFLADEGFGTHTGIVVDEKGRRLSKVEVFVESVM